MAALVPLSDAARPYLLTYFVLSCLLQVTNCTSGLLPVPAKELSLAA